mgnify:CR=1 FL=1
MYFDPDFRKRNTSTIDCKLRDCLLRIQKCNVKIIFRYVNVPFICQKIYVWICQIMIFFQIGFMHWHVHDWSMVTCGWFYDDEKFIGFIHDMRKVIGLHSNFMLFILHLKFRLLMIKDRLINANVIRNFIISKINIFINLLLNKFYYSFIFKLLF